MMYFPPGIHFAEQPAGADEVAVAGILKTLYQARKARDKHGILSLYDPTARLQGPRTKQYFSLADFEAYLEATLSSLAQTYYRDTVIRMEDAETAHIFTIATYIQTPLRGKESIGPAFHDLKLRKIHGVWKIIETRWD